MTTIRKVQAHNAAVRPNQSSVDSKVGRRARIGLNVDTPSAWIQAESRSGTIMGQKLNLVNNFIATIVSTRNSIIEPIENLFLLLKNYRALGWPSEYLLCKQDPRQSMTASVVKFSLAIISNPFFCRSFSSRIKLYISGSSFFRGVLRFHSASRPFFVGHVCSAMI